MFDTAGTIWQKIQEFMKDIRTLKANDAETEKELVQFKREFDLVHREFNTIEKVQNAQGRELETLKDRVKKLESEKHGLAVKLGKEKKKTERLSSTSGH